MAKTESLADLLVLYMQAKNEAVAAIDGLSKEFPADFNLARLVGDSEEAIRQALTRGWRTADRVRAVTKTFTPKATP